MIKKFISKQALKLGEQKLASSGLTLADAKQLHICCLSGAETAALHPSFKPLCSLKLNYLGPDGKPLADWPQAKPFYRLRYLEHPAGFDTVAGVKEVRYVQEPDTLPVAYYPTNQAWKELVADPAQPLIVTEGELKAAKACKEGFPTIGLGGTHSWRARKQGVGWLPSLQLISWVRRAVYVCFDTDYRTNANVCLALRELAEELAQRGAYVYLVDLPAAEDAKKLGLDDFLVAAGPTARVQLAQLLHDAEPLGFTRVLWELNERYAYIADPGLIVNQASHAKISPAAFKDHLEAPAAYQERQLRSDGAVSYKAVSAAAAWIRWPLRNVAARLTYEPGAGRFPGAPPRFNIWPGWGLTPAPGDLTLFLRLVNHLFTGAEPAAQRWFLRWCAYPLRYPGVKHFTSVVLHGIRHGTGKSLIGYTLGQIYGKNFTEISQIDLHNHFNEWAEGKQLVMGDDVTGGNKRADADFLKKLITQKELRVNAKYVPTYVVPDCINYFFTANHPDSFFLEDDDRRFFIHEVAVEPLDEEFYVQYDLWLAANGGAAVFDYLLKLDLGDFNPAAPALRTSARDRMIVNMQSDLAGWVRQLIAAPDEVLRLGELPLVKDLFTSKELLQLYDPLGKTGTTANGLGRELARAGVRQVLEGRPLKLNDGTQARYYAVRSGETWLRCSAHEAAAHLNGWQQRQAAVKIKY